MEEYHKQLEAYYKLKHEYEEIIESNRKNKKKHEREQGKKDKPTPFKPVIPVCPSCHKTSNNITFKRGKALFYGCDQCRGVEIPLQRGYLYSDYLERTNNNLTELKQQMIRRKIDAKYGYAKSNIEDLTTEYANNDIWKATFEKHNFSPNHEKYELWKKTTISKIKASIVSGNYKQAAKYYKKLNEGIEKYEKKHFTREIVDKGDQLLYVRQPNPLINIMVSHDIVDLKPTTKLEEKSFEEEEAPKGFIHPDTLNITMKESAKSMTSCPKKMEDVWDIPAELSRDNRYASNHGQIKIGGEVFTSKTYDKKYKVQDAQLEPLFNMFKEPLETGMLVIQYGFNRGYIPNYLHDKGYTAIVISITNSNNYEDNHAKIALDMKLTGKVKHILIRGSFMLDTLPKPFTQENTMVIIDEALDTGGYINEAFTIKPDRETCLRSYKTIYAIGEGLQSPLLYDATKLYVKYKHETGIAEIVQPNIILSMSNGKVEQNSELPEQIKPTFQHTKAYIYMDTDGSYMNLLKYYKTHTGPEDKIVQAMKKVYGDYPEIKRITPPTIPKIDIEDYVKQNTKETLEGSSTKQGLEFISKYKTNIMFEIGFNTGKSGDYLLRQINALMSFDLGQHDYVIPAKQYIDHHHPNKHILIIGDSKISFPLALKYIIRKQYNNSAIFIDGNHMYNGACNDLIYSSRLVPTIILDNVAPHKGAGIQVYLALRHYLEGTMTYATHKFIEHFEIGDYQDGIAVLSSKYEPTEMDPKHLERRMRFVKLVAENADKAEIEWLRGLEGNYTDNK